MNKLREKLRLNVFSAKYGKYATKEIVNECEQITDDFSVKFAEWSRLNYAYFVKGIFYRNTYDLKMGIGFTMSYIQQYFKNNIYGKE